MIRDVRVFSCFLFTGGNLELLSYFRVALIFVAAVGLATDSGHKPVMPRTLLYPASRPFSLIHKLCHVGNAALGAQFFRAVSALCGPY